RLGGRGPRTVGEEYRQGGTQSADDCIVRRRLSACRAQMTKWATLDTY
ncbi:uncharacterized protein PITG_22091, partial [Phytophthora infestans T30-4]